MRKLQNTWALVLTGLFLFGMTALGQEIVVPPDEPTTIDRSILELDVAIDPATLRVSTASSFVIEGYIYSSGTITANEGVVPGGGPEFPDEVIGHFTCKGWVVQPRPEDPSIPGSNTVQLWELDLENGQGTQMLVSRGYELGVFSLESQRPVIGATGEFSDKSLEQRQVVIGLNVNGGVNLRVNFRNKYNIDFKNAETE